LNGIRILVYVCQPLQYFITERRLSLNRLASQTEVRSLSYVTSFCPQNNAIKFDCHFLIGCCIYDCNHHDGRLTVLRYNQHDIYIGLSIFRIIYICLLSVYTCTRISWCCSGQKLRNFRLCNRFRIIEYIIVIWTIYLVDLV